MSRRPLLRSTSPTRTGAIVVALAVLASVVALAHWSPFGGDGGRTVRALFAQANEVHAQTPVRIDGVKVGHVERLERGPGNTTALVMRLTRSGVALHADARARIAWRTLLGGSMYIDVDPGSLSAAPLAGPIPVSATSSQVDWDQLNSVLPAQTRRAFGQMLSGMQEGLDAPRGIGRTLQAAPPALDAIGPAADAFRGRRPGDLPDLVRSAGRSAAAMSASPAALRQLVAGASATLAVTAADRAALAATLRLAPPALDATTTVSRSLDRTLARLDPLVDELRPGVRRLAPVSATLRPMLAEASRVLDDAKPLLRAAPPALRAVSEMSIRGGHVVRQLRSPTTRLDRELIPFLDSTDADTKLKVFQAIGPFFAAVSSAAGQFDGSSYFLHFDASAALNTASVGCDIGYVGEQLSRCTAVGNVLRKIAGKGKR